MGRELLSTKSVTINLPRSLDAYLRWRAKREKRSMNSIVVEAINLYFKGGRR